MPPPFGLLPGGELVVGPSVAQQEAAALTLLVAATAERVTMLEAEGAQVGRAGDGLRIAYVGEVAE